MTKLWKWLENQNWTISLRSNILKHLHLLVGSLKIFVEKLLAASLDTFKKLRPKWEGKKIPDNTKYLMEKVVFDWIGSI